MRNGFLGSLAALLLGGGFCVSLAQSPVPTNALGAPQAVVEKKPAPTAPDNSALFSPFFVSGSTTPTTWGNASFLLWRFSSAPVNAPLLTTTTDASSVGTIGNSATQVLAGNDFYNPGWQSGYGLTFGRWFGADERFGIELSAFYFGPHSTTIFSGATGDSSKILAIPFNGILATPPAGARVGGIRTALPDEGENAILLSGDRGMAGSSTIVTDIRLWGTEINGVINLSRSKCGFLNLLVGFRYVDLIEDLDIDYGSVPNFLPAFPVERAVSIHDHFGSRNQAYTAQIALKGDWTSGILFVSAAGKLAMGVNHETLDINGHYSDPLPFLINNFGASNTGGFFATQTNSGRQNHNRFVVIPEVNIQVGLNVTRNLRLVTGYDAMYLSSVVRAGNQIDRTVNTSQIGSAAGGFTPTVFGPASPQPQFNQSSFWAQGVNFGVEYRY